MMEQFKKIISGLQNDTVKVMQCLSRLLMSDSKAKETVSRGVEDYMCELENLCVRSRNILERYTSPKTMCSGHVSRPTISDIVGEIEVTRDGWLKLTLGTLLPNCRHRISGYIGSTIGKLLDSFHGELPYFDNAFMAIVEYCNLENHNALDNDNKGWKMIPNSLKGRVIQDDNQFILSIGLFTKNDENLRCEVYVMPPEDGSLFMDLLARDML